jgi:predicted nucleic acid-binding protein
MTSSINVAEIHAGMRDEEHDRTEQLIAGLECLTLTASIAKYAGDLKREWSRRGRTLTLADTIVAATALEHGCAVVTDNQKDFPMSELQLYPLPS